MKTLYVLLSFCLVVALARPQENSGSGAEGGGHGNEGGHQGGRRPHPDCPDLKPLIAGKCTDRTNTDCFKCIFDGCHPKDEQAIPTCEEITTCVTANIEKC